MKLIAERTFELIAWTDRLNLEDASINETFDFVKICWIAWKTDSEGLRSLCIRFRELDSNIGENQNADGTRRAYCPPCIFLDPMADVTVYTENTKSVVPLRTAKHNLNQLEYFIYINNQGGYSGISSNNPVIINMEFYKE